MQGALFSENFSIFSELILIFVAESSPLRGERKNMTMDKKPYPQNEEQPMVAGEPAVAYGSVAMPHAAQYQSTPYEPEDLQRSEEDSKAGRVYAQEEVDKMVEEWLQPLTMEQVNRWNEEAEEADEADAMDTFVPHEAVVERMTRWMNSL